MMFSIVDENRLKGELFVEYNSSCGKVTTVPLHTPFGKGGNNGLESV